MLLPFQRNRPGGFLLPPRALNWFALEAQPLAQLVKVGRGRKTWRVQTEGDLAFYAKVFEPTGPRFWMRLKRLVEADAAKREWKTLCRAAARGVPAPQVVSLCMHGTNGRSVFVTEEITHARSLARTWSDDVELLPKGRRAVVATLAEAVARAFAEAHRAGFVHRDAHPENILLQETPDGLRAVFVDVRGAHLSRGPASLKRAARSIAQLDHFFRRRATRTERLRFLKSYLGGTVSRKLGREGRDSLGAINQSGVAHARALARQRDRRTRRSAKYFGKIDLGKGHRATVVLKLARRHVFPEPQVPDRTPDEWRSLLQPIVFNRLAPHDLLCVEEQSVRRWSALLGWSLRGSPARRAFLHSHCLRHRDILSELILGYVEHRNSLGMIDRAWLIRPGRPLSC